MLPAIGRNSASSSMARSLIPAASINGSSSVRSRTIVNTHEHDDHVFHIHTNPFQVVSVNGNALAVPEWRDSVIVERKGGRVVFRSRFLDFTGVYMVHCHMMNHEEMGMMQTVEVYKS